MSKKKQVQFVFTTPDDLAKLIVDKVNEALESKLQGLKATPEKKEFITRDETAKLLNVTHTTLWRYANSGKLKPYHFKHSDKVYYKLSEILDGFKKSL